MEIAWLDSLVFNAFDHVFLAGYKTPGVHLAILSTYTLYHLIPQLICHPYRLAAVLGYVLGENGHRILLYICQV